MNEGSDAGAPGSFGFLSWFCPSCQLCKMVSTNFVATRLILLGLVLCKACLLHRSRYWKCMMLLRRRKRV